MRRRLAILSIVALGSFGLGLTPAAVAVRAHHVHPSHALIIAKHCPPGYVKAKIGGKTKCLHAGEYCSPRYQKQYRHYGFRCVWYGGAYRLR
jgi:hypothetical protein